MAREKIRLGIDFSKLYKTVAIDVGGKSVVLRPLTYRQWGDLLAKVDLIIEKCTEEGISLENFRNPDKLLTFAKILVVDFVDVLSEASGIHEEDLEQLPIEVILDILNAVIRVNLESKEDLQKNFDSLTKTFRGLAQNQEK